MANSGHQYPEPPEDADGQDRCASPFDSALLDALDLAQRPDAELEEILRRKIAPNAPQETAQSQAARIEIDRRMVARCAAEGFDGPNTKKLLVVAFEYANPVVGYLVGTGQIFREVARLGRPVKRQSGDHLWTAEDRAFLTERCVDLGVFTVFHEYGLKKGGWDHRRGTALTTYAVNACSLSFATVYPKWWRGRVLERSFGDLSFDLPQHLQVDRREPDLAEQVVNRLEAERLLSQFPEPARTALWLRGMHDATQAEAAVYVHLSEKALESRIGRARGKLGLTRASPPDPVCAPTPDPDPELDAQEGDRDR